MRTARERERERERDEKKVQNHRKIKEFSISK